MVKSIKTKNSNKATIVLGLLLTLITPFIFFIAAYTYAASCPKNSGLECIGYSAISPFVGWAVSIVWLLIAISVLAYGMFSNSKIALKPAKIKSPVVGTALTSIGGTATVLYILFVILTKTSSDALNYVILVMLASICAYGVYELYRFKNNSVKHSAIQAVAIILLAIFITFCFSWLNF